LLVIATWARSAATLAYRLATEGVPVPGSAQLRTAVLEDRDFWLWRHAVTAGLNQACTDGASAGNSLGEAVHGKM
jgi:hypothetical protein